ncbi:MAG: hypothetical protein GX647_10805, partial [Clostridiales bacterium]|nr:hypothetical protein [Clostridiales bacterium]
MKRFLKQEKRYIRRLTKNGVSLVCLALMFALMVGMLLGTVGGTISISSKAVAEMEDEVSAPPEPSGGSSGGSSSGTSPSGGSSSDGSGSGPQERSDPADDEDDSTTLIGDIEGDPSGPEGEPGAGSTEPGVEGETPEQEETSGEGETSGGEETLDEGEPSGGEETPDEGEISGGEETPDEGETSGGEETPDEGETSGGEETPDEGEPSGGEETPDEGETSGEEENALPEEDLRPSGSAPGEGGGSGDTGEQTEVSEPEGEPEAEPEDTSEGETEGEPEGTSEGEPEGTSEGEPEEEQTGSAGSEGEENGGGLTEELLPSGFAPDGGDGTGGDDIIAEPISAGPTDDMMLMSSLGGAEEPMLMGALDEPVGSGDVVEAYAIPAGMAYIKEIGADFSYSNDATNNAITNALKDALTYIKSLYEEPGTPSEKTATIVVGNGVYQGGLSIAGSDGDTVLKDLIDSILNISGTDSASTMRLNIVAEDAIDGDGNIHENSAGGAQLEGDVKVEFEGLNVMLAGLYLSTRGLVSVNGAESFSYYGTSQDDVVDMELTDVEKEIVVRTGAGDDKVSVKVHKKPTVKAEISLQQGYQEAFQSLTSLTSTEFAELPTEIQNAITTIIDNIESLVLDPSLDFEPIAIDISLGLGNDLAEFKLIDSTDLKLG